MPTMTAQERVVRDLETQALAAIAHHAYVRANSLLSSQVERARGALSVWCALLVAAYDPYACDYWGLPSPEWAAQLLQRADNAVAELGGYAHSFSFGALAAARDVAWIVRDRNRKLASAARRRRERPLSDHTEAYAQLRRLLRP